MNILSVFGLLVILLKCVAASGEDVGVAFKEAVDGEDFLWLEANGERWWRRKDLFDYVMAKGADVTVRFIQNARRAKRCALAALFDQGEKGVIDEVLGRINYNDYDLRFLTNYQSELAGSPEKFFRVIDKIIDPESQESAVREGVINLFKAEKHDLVVPLVNALGKRTFKGKSLEEEAIQKAFWEGVKGGNQDMVELYYEHPAITEKYADGLKASWNNGKPNQVFQFLLKQADQGDLDEAKERYPHAWLEQFRLAIDEAPKPVPPAGTRHRRPIERAIAKLTMDTLGIALGTGMWHQEPGSILASYLVGEEGWTKEIEKMKLEKQKASENGGQEITSRVEEDGDWMSKMCKIL